MISEDDTIQYIGDYHYELQESCCWFVNQQRPMFEDTVG